jgi:hypothetical protein
MKINISILGNCQLLPLANILKKNEIFNVTYASPYSEISKLKDLVNKINYCDIFIATLTNNNYRKDIELGTEYLISILSNRTSYIIAPSIYFTGYFPTFGSHKDFDALSYNFENKEFYFSKYHDYLAMILAKNKILNFNYEDLQHKQFDEILNNNNNKTFLELKNREKNCSVIISDFLEEIYNKKICFYTYNHPCDEILFNLYEKIIKKIKNFIEIKFIFSPESKKFLRLDNQTYVHDFILKYLNIKLNENKMSNEIFNKIIEYYKNKNFIINQNSQPYINSIEILQKASKNYENLL